MTRLGLGLLILLLLPGLSACWVRKEAGERKEGVHDALLVTIAPEVNSTL